MPKVRVNDIEIFYQTMGAPDAEPVLLIMGWGGDHTGWAFQVPALSQDFRVIVFDNRGAGQSDAPDIPYTIAGMAADTLALLDRLGVERAHVAGASMGGMIAEEIALSRPDRVRTLQLHCTLARPDRYGHFLVDAFLRVKTRADREEYARTIIPWVLGRRTFADKPGFVDAFLERAVTYQYAAGLVGLTRQAQAIAGHDTLERLAGIRVPTLITVGADDILVPPAFSREIHSRLPRAELTVIPDAGHLHFMEQPEAFNDVMLAFLRKHLRA